MVAIWSVDQAEPGGLAEEAASTPVLLTREARVLLDKELQAACGAAVMRSAVEPVRAEPMADNQFGSCGGRTTST